MDSTYSSRYKYPIASGTSPLYSKDESCFRIASEVSKMSTYRKFHTGCIAVCNHRIVSSGFNSCKSDPLQKELNSIRFIDDMKSGCEHLIHAEVSCIKPLIGSKDLEQGKVKVYVSRTGKNGKARLSRPCPSCMKLLKDSGVRWVYYTGNDEFFKENVVTGKIVKLTDK